MAPQGPVVGGSEAALHLPTVLSFMAILVAGMQGTLVLESTRPCRISTSKVILVLFLEFIEVAIVFASEILTYIGLNNALRVRIQWLQWTPLCVLILGLMQLSLDACFTLDIVAESRVNYRPISVRKNDSLAWELLMFFVTLTLSMLLVGWRQRWWWHASPVSSEVAIAKARDEISLSTPVMAIAIGFAFALLGSMFFYAVIGELLYINSNSSLIRRTRYLFASNRWHNVAPDPEAQKLGPRYPSPTLIGQYRLIAPFREVRSITDTTQMRDAAYEPSDDEIRLNLMYEPLRLGNMVVGEDVEEVQKSRHDVWERAYRIFTFTETLVIIPLMVAVVVAVARLHNSLDKAMFEALKELSEVVIVVAFLDLAITLKNILWNYSEKPKPVSPLPNQLFSVESASEEDITDARPVKRRPQRAETGKS